MEKLHIERKASDNKYLHKDFHISADIGITYVGENYGDRAVKDYLTQYTKSFYKLLAEDVNKNGLKSLEENLNNFVPSLLFLISFILFQYFFLN